MGIVQQLLGTMGIQSNKLKKMTFN
uniref:Uncharacterized protein n=1 Tax=Arundo donax TaxID=35708 RepID=A0A0A9FH15_ARUDO